jgi:two-component system CheB/CheR fusion protein
MPDTLSGPESTLSSTSVEKRVTEKIYIAGIGASAGGLEALERLFKNMPVDTGIAFVIIQHLSPDFKSVMDELLARHTRMPIHRVTNGMTVEANSIYLIPPKKEMIISGGRLLLTDKDPEQELSLPIDHFFRSLAHDAGKQAIAVVLSGTGSDGSRGIRDVREAGGFVIAQSAETAKFDGMPRSAIDTGCVDADLTPEQMPEAIAGHVARRGGARDANGNGHDGDGALYGVEAIFKLLRDEYGIDFSHYKPNTVSRRIERRLSLNQSVDLEDYVQRVKADPSELNALYKDLLIGVTRFFRDREAFEQIERLLPDMLAQKRPDEEIRFWVAGAATGEEAYSLAILLHERMELLRRPISTKIFATDVHGASLEFASAGVYDGEALAEVPPARLARYFSRKNDGYHVVPELRQMIVFARHNVIKDAPFTKLDFISCRNLLIYFQPLVQKKVISLFHFGLRTGGVLFLGPSESPGELMPEFQALDDHWKIYRKRRDIRLPPDMRLPLSMAAPHVRVTAPAPAQAMDASLLSAYDRLLDEFMPPGLLITDRRQLVHAFGGAGRFLTHRDGRPTSDILDLVDGNLKLALAGSLQRAAKDLTAVVYTGVRLGDAGAEKSYKLTVKPILNRQANLTHLLISLEEMDATPADKRSTATEIDVSEASREQLSSLESELRHTRENLQATIEELETSNEELQASNEELVAGNEELQSTNEELHSVNEELYTVNAEYQKKIVELTELTDDMDNLLRSTEVATIFIDRDMCIRKFTPHVGRVFDFLPQDVGRRIDSFSHHLDGENLHEDVAAVLASGKPVEKQVRHRTGAWFFLRILPYRSHTRLEGVVLTLVDIATVKRAEEEAREALRRRDQFLAMLSHELRNPLAAVVNASRLLEVGDLDAETLDIARGTIRRQSQHMARLLDDLLDVSRITRDKIEIRRQAVDLRQAARDALESIRPLLETRTLALHISIPEQPILVDGDPARLQQIAVNLLNNAIRYTPANGQIWFILRAEKGHAYLTVRDTGAGIPFEMRDKIFELFVQLQRDSGSATGGMGVGLTLVRALVNLHGGQVTVESDGPGKGSQFTVRLPVIEKQAAPATPASDTTPLSHLRVLLVEDNADIRAVTERLLRTMDCEVVLADNGTHALEAVKCHRPDVALIDIGLPELDGYEVAKRIRHMSDHDGIKLIALTGFGQPDDRARALASGFDAHVVKPVDLNDLYGLLCNLTRRKR